MNLFPLALALIPIPVNSELKILMFLLKVSSAHVTSSKLLLFCSYATTCIYYMHAASLRGLVHRTFRDTKSSLKSTQRQCDATVKFTLRLFSFTQKVFYNFLMLYLLLIKAFFLYLIFNYPSFLLGIVRVAVGRNS